MVRSAHQTGTGVSIASGQYAGAKGYVVGTTPAHILVREVTDQRGHQSKLLGPLRIKPSFLITDVAMSVEVPEPFSQIKVGERVRVVGGSFPGCVAVVSEVLPVKIRVDIVIDAEGHDMHETRCIWPSSLVFESSPEDQDVQAATTFQTRSSIQSEIVNESDAVVVSDLDSDLDNASHTSDHDFTSDSDTAGASEHEMEASSHSMKVTDSETEFDSETFVIVGRRMQHARVLVCT